MTPISIIVCAFEICFNPAQITYMETKHISSDCQINFAGSNTNYVTISGHACEEVTAEINKQIAEKAIR